MPPQVNEALYDDQQGGDGSVHLSAVLPGGEAADPVERYLALILLAAIGAIILLRRGFPKAR